MENGRKSVEQEYYTPQEVADILKIKKTTVYDMIKKGTLKAIKMGKQFRISKESLQEALGQEVVKSSTQPFGKENSILESSIPDHTVYETQNIIVCGQDIVLDMLCQSANEELKENKFVRSYQGSYNGLLALYYEEAQIATAHLWDKDTDTYNLPFIRMMLPGERISVYHVLNRPVFLYVRKGNPKKITSIHDLTRSDVTFANREKGSGIRVLVDSLLTSEGILSLDVKGYDKIATSHLAAASMIARGEADCAFGNLNGASQFQNVDTIFLKNEQYDLVLRKDLERKPEIQTLLRILQSESFREEISAMGEYDTTDMGKKLF